MKEPAPRPGPACVAETRVTGPSDQDGNAHLSRGGLGRAAVLRAFIALRDTGRAVSENLDLVRSIVAAHARGDYSSSEWAHPDIEYSIVGGLFSGDWKGRPAMARAARELFSTWRGHRSVVDEIRPLDNERVLVLSHVIARARKSAPPSSSRM